MTEIEQIRQKLKELGDKKKAEIVKKYMKSPYDFYGIKVPELRKIAKGINLEFYDALNLFDELWNSRNHEEMGLGLYLIHKYRKKYGLEIWKFLMERIEKAKTWDHIDELGMHTIGEIVAENLGLVSEIKKMSESGNPWMRRLSIVSNYPLIKKNKIDLTFRLAEVLIYDDNEYVQKGAGWMLREAGKKQRIAVRDFILRHLNMKPVAFSYAIEKMKELREERKKFESKNEPYFVIIRGPAGVGKTTIAKKLGERLNADVVSIDNILEVLGLDKVEGECISEKNFLKANKHAIPSIKKILKEGGIIILEGNFYHKTQLDNLLKNLKHKNLVFTLKAGLDECIKRDKTRKELGEEGIKAVHSLVSKFDYGIVLNTDNKSEEEVINDILFCLKK